MKYIPLLGIGIIAVVSVALAVFVSRPETTTDNRSQAQELEVQNQAEKLQEHIEVLKEKAEDIEEKENPGRRLCFDQAGTENGQLVWNATRIPLTQAEQSAYDAWNDLGKPDTARCVQVQLPEAQ